MKKAGKAVNAFQVATTETMMSATCSRSCGVGLALAVAVGHHRHSFPTISCIDGRAAGLVRLVHVNFGYQLHAPSRSFATFFDWRSQSLP